jgi:serine/threonine protein kinase
MSDFLVGARVLDRYRVVRPLGSGGMGVVYLGRTEGSAGFTRPVVIKRLQERLAGERAHNEMFAREARILSNLQHPNIVSVVDFGQDGGGYVMILEYVHGYDLDQWSNFVWSSGRKHSADNVLYIARRVLAALHYAHSLRRPDGALANIVHRDVSLSNVLIDTQAQVKLHDFGIARMEGGTEAQTETGVFKGKLGLAAPELLLGDRASPRSDLYSLGVMTYQLLSGVNPFRGKDPGNTMYRVLHHKHSPLAAQRDDLPSGLDEVLDRAMHKDADERFEDAAQFAQALGALCSRSDEEVGQRMALQLVRDFDSLALATELESLSARDAAWRDAQMLTDAMPLPLSSSPPRYSPEQPTALRSTLPPARPPPASPDPFGQFTTVTETLPDGKPLPARRLRWAVAGAALLLLGGAVSAFMTRTPASPAPQYVVSENPPAAPPPPSNALVSSPTPERPPEQRVEAQPTPPTRIGGPGGKAPAQRPDASTLTREFRRHQARVEKCIQEHPDQMDRYPQISVRFEVNSAGKVTAAELTPPALAGKPLGVCILGVARAVQFSPLSKAVAFSIPISARRTP